MFQTQKERQRASQPLARRCVDCSAPIPTARPQVNLCEVCSADRDQNVPAHTD